MKLVASIFLFSLLITPPEWRSDFKKAQLQAAEEHKLILLTFTGSDWCGTCIHLKKTIFWSEVFINYAADNLVLVMADFPRPKKYNKQTEEHLKQNELLADQYNFDGLFPYTVLLDASGKVIKKWTDMHEQSPEKFVEEMRTTVDTLKLNSATH